MADEHGHSNRRGAERQVGQLENLLRLRADLRLLVGLVAVPGPVHREVVLVGRLAAKLLHPLRARAQRLGRCLLDHEPTVEPRARGPRRRERTNLLVAALAEQAQRDGADRARRSDDRDPLAPAQSSSRSNASCRAVTARGTSSVRTWQAILIGDVEITFDSTPISSSVANVFAAIPGSLFMPAPTRLTLPRAPRI